MKLVNIGAKSWVNPEHVVAVEIVDEGENRVQVHFLNGTSAITGLFNAGAVVDGLVSISERIWVKPDAIVSFVVNEDVATVRMTPGAILEFKVIVEDDAQIAEVLDYFETGGALE